MTARSGLNTSAFQAHLPPFGDRRHRRIGLLGGSFNPAHEGHLHLSREALKRLRLDAVWWLVSPQNPLKDTKDMAPLASRLGHAREVARTSPRVVANDLERRLGTTRTARTLAALKRRYPNISFVWLIGSDNLAQLPRWWRWACIFKGARVAVFDRSPYSYRALAGAAAGRFSKNRVRQPAGIWHRDPPAWAYVAMRRHPASATALRAKRVAA